MTGREPVVPGTGPDEPGLVVTAASRPLRRVLGPTAWAVLEDLALDARPDHDGRMVAPTSCRRVSEHLGVTKDTAAKAIARLARAGLVVREEGRNPQSGVFTGQVYVVQPVALEGLGWVLEGRSDLLLKDQEPPSKHRPEKPDKVGPDMGETVTPATVLGGSQPTLFDPSRL